MDNQHEDIIDELHFHANVVSTNNECLEPDETKDDTGVYMRAIAEIRKLRAMLTPEPQDGFTDALKGAHVTDVLNTSNQYEKFVEHVMLNGAQKKDRTGTGTRSVFGYQMRFNLQDGFPLVTTKLVHVRSIIHELLWFLRGDTNIKYLKDNNVSIWDEWADENGDLGPVYGSQWRSWPQYCDYAQSADIPWPEDSVFGHVENGYKIGLLKQGIDQISNLINDLRSNPDSRRLIVSAWNVAEIPNMKLPPCHAFFQFYTTELTLDQRIAAYYANNLNASLQINESAMSDAELHSYLDSDNVPRRRLSCQLYQRSCDIGLGCPFNIASYAFLTHMIAQQLDMVVGDFIWTGGDCHIYDSHVTQLTEQLTRQPYAYPQLELTRKPDSIFDYMIDDFKIVNYQHHPVIKMPVAV